MISTHIFNAISRLVNAPEREAREIADQVRMRDDKTLRLTLFSLQKYIKVLLDTIEVFPWS
jgi:hypothetical protein